MAVTPSLLASGTQTATINTDHTLYNMNVAGLVTFHVDTVNMAAGDTLRLYIVQKVLTGGATGMLAETWYGGAQSLDTIKVSLPIATNLAETGGIEFHLQQTTGTGRAYPWKVMAY
jgi:hypothetical protein